MFLRNLCIKNLAALLLLCCPSLNIVHEENVSKKHGSTSYMIEKRLFCWSLDKAELNTHRIYSRSSCCKDAN